MFLPKKFLKKMFPPKKFLKIMFTFLCLSIKLLLYF